MWRVGVNRTSSHVTATAPHPKGVCTAHHFTLEAGISGFFFWLASEGSKACLSSKRLLLLQASSACDAFHFSLRSNLQRARFDAWRVMREELLCFDSGQRWDDQHLAPWTSTGISWASIEILPPRCDAFSWEGGGRRGHKQRLEHERSEICGMPCSRMLCRSPLSPQRHVSNANRHRAARTSRIRVTKGTTAANPPPQGGHHIS